MFFYLSKIIWIILQPFTVICFLLLASVFLKNSKWKKRTFWTAFGLLFFLSNDFIANEVMRAWEIPAVPYAEMKKYKVGIVLTGATQSGLTPNDRVYFTKGADRVYHTVELFKKGLLDEVIISGGTSRIIPDGDEPEADKFKKAMVVMGIPDSVITIENVTRNTAESPRAVVKIIRDKNLSKEDCLLITSAFHMRRSLACYKKAGMAVQPFSTDFYSERRTFQVHKLLIPQLDALVKWHRLTREWIGMVAYKMAGYI